MSTIHRERMSLEGDDFMEYSYRPSVAPIVVCKKIFFIEVLILLIQTYIQRLYRRQLNGCGENKKTKQHSRLRRLLMGIDPRPLINQAKTLYGLNEELINVRG